MDMPATFAAVIKEMNTDELIELREWNDQARGANKHANAAIDAELKSRGIIPANED